MNVVVREIENEQELDEVLRLRHQVMVEEEEYMPPRPDARIVDEYDHLPETAHLVALRDGQIIAAVRLTERGEAGTPADELFDFTPFLPDDARSGSGSMLVAARAVRDTPRGAIGLAGTTLCWARQRGLTHLVASANPERALLFQWLGFHAVAPEFHHREADLPVLPMVLDLDRVEQVFSEFMQRHLAPHWLSSAQRRFGQAGDTIVRHGEPGDVAYVIIDGRATVVGASGTIASLGPGDVFGELALLTSGRRTADVIAQTDLDLMVIPRESFHEQIRQVPAASDQIVRLLAERLATLTSAA